MKKSFLIMIIPLVVLLCFTLSCQQGEDLAEEAESKANIEADKKALEMIREKELTAFNAGDVEGFISICTEDVVFDAPNSPATVGEEDVRAMLEASFARNDYDGSSYPVDEEVILEDWAFDRGVWIEKRMPKDGGEPNLVSFGILQIYKRQDDGSWKLARSIWNIKGPPQPLPEKE